MSIGTTIIGLILLFIFIGPIAYLIIHQQAKKKKIALQIKEVTAMYHMNITEQFDIEGHYFILDLDKRFLLYIHMIKNEIANHTLYPIYKITHLSYEVKRSSTAKSTQSIGQLIWCITIENEHIHQIKVYDESDGNWVQAEAYQHQLQVLTTKLKPLL
ncbi:hypothetical protein ACG2LH_17065 [Zhouia sp. PK063]|uniref:hypothetical protein n=1 Tax=Zhouia sp. PK063 TaxID=3373602 RepID=UPI0037B606D0